MAIGVLSSIGIALVGVVFAATGEYVDGITLIIIGVCWIDVNRINSELEDLKSEIAELRRTSNDGAHKRKNIVIG